MKRFHVHISVDKLVESIQFYSGMFAGEPAELRPDCAKWKLVDPRVNFAISQRGAKVVSDHCGIHLRDEGELPEKQSHVPGVMLHPLAALYPPHPNQARPAANQGSK